MNYKNLQKLNNKITLYRKEVMSQAKVGLIFTWSMLTLSSWIYFDMSTQNKMINTSYLLLGLVGSLTAVDADEKVRKLQKQKIENTIKQILITKEPVPHKGTLSQQRHLAVVQHNQDNLGTYATIFEETIDGEIINRWDS